MTDSIKIVGLGEILWDIFSESDCFGGAPANFACSAAGITGGSEVVSDRPSDSERCCDGSGVCNFGESSCLL